MTSPLYLSDHYQGKGTGFLIFAQPRFVRFFRTPVPIHLPARAGTIRSAPPESTRVWDTPTPSSGPAAGTPSPPSPAPKESRWASDQRHYAMHVSAS